MARTPNIYGGGATTNLNGLAFEQTSSLDDALVQAGFRIDNNRVYDVKGSLLGYSVQKYKFYKVFLDAEGVDYRNYNSKQWLPDDAFVNKLNHTVYIIEKKFQNSSGSVDEKLPNCDFKKKEYEKLCGVIGYDVEFIYILSEWFKQDSYRDTLDYIESVHCSYYFNELPLEAIGLCEET